MSNLKNNPKVHVPSIKLRDMTDKEFNQWFKVSSYNIKFALEGKLTILGPNNIEYKLFRKSLLNEKEGINSGITKGYSLNNMLVSSV